MTEIVLSATAIRGLNSGFRFYERKESGLGEHFKRTLLGEIEGLEITAGIHRVVYGHHRLISRTFPFAVYYKADPGQVTVWAVIDCRRNPEWIRNQLEG